MSVCYGHQTVISRTITYYIDAISAILLYNQLVGDMYDGDWILTRHM